MNYTPTKNILNTFKKNELHIKNIIRSSRKNKLNNPLNNLIYNYQNEGMKRKKKLQDKNSTNSSTGIFRKSIQKSPINKEKIKKNFSLNNLKNKHDLRLSSSSEGNNSNSNMTNSNSKISINDEIKKEKDFIISKLEKEIGLNNKNKVLGKQLSINDYNKKNLSKTKSSNNITMKNCYKGKFTFSDLLNQIGKNKVDTPRYTSKMLLENKCVKRFHKLIILKKKKYIQRNYSVGYNLKNNYSNKDEKQNFSPNIQNIYFSLLERTKNLCEKYRKFCDK